ncbi:hypothetical protein [Deinococcus sp. QL22]|uniref:hypothetical protein n=1 Tax=Deinococcus sp. QL22 TaxID=2939437 RepID=UPI002016BA8D|nr:hypothetical protein [Deinococcus sp. QL22]
MDDQTAGLKSIPFDVNDLIRGDDGEFYHLPTLRALNAAGRLSPDSIGYLLLLERSCERTRLIA